MNFKRTDPLAQLRTKLLDLEECDDPGYREWEQRVDQEVMPRVAFTLGQLVYQHAQTIGAAAGEPEPAPATVKQEGDLDQCWSPAEHPKGRSPRFTARYPGRCGASCALDTIEPGMDVVMIDGVIHHDDCAELAGVEVFTPGRRD